MTVDFHRLTVTIPLSRAIELAGESALFNRELGAEFARIEANLVPTNPTLEPHRAQTEPPTFLSSITTEVRQLLSQPGEHRIEAIRLVRSAARIHVYRPLMSLADAKNFVDTIQRNTVRNTMRGTTVPEGEEL